MISDGLVLERACTQCGASAKTYYAQRCGDGALTWSASYRCDACGNAVEADGGEELPESVRSVFLIERGTWRLMLMDAAGRTLDLVLALARALRITSKAALERVNAIPAYLAEGTNVEMRCLERRLASAEARLSVERKPGP